MIRIPIIKVKDTTDNIEHIVGTDIHDSLIIKNNAIHYLNLQCMEGTQYNGDYKFVGIEGDMHDPETTVEFVTIEELARLYKDIAREQNEREERLQSFIKEVLAEEEKGEEIRKRQGYIFHT